jgi:hypothetical protein
MSKIKHALLFFICLYQIINNNLYCQRIKLDSICEFGLIGNQLLIKNEYKNGYSAIELNGQFGSSNNLDQLKTKDINQLVILPVKIDDIKFEILDIDSICQIYLFEPYFITYLDNDSLYTNFYKVRVRLDTVALDFYLYSLNSKVELQQNVKNFYINECKLITFNGMKFIFIRYEFYASMTSNINTTLGIQHMTFTSFNQ